MRVPYKSLKKPSHGVTVSELVLSFYYTMPEGADPSDRLLGLASSHVLSISA
jgi:hypothetical protein